MVCKRWYSIFKTYRFLPDQTRVEKKRCGVSGFFPKCTKYKLVVFDTLVRLVFFSLPTIANSQGFAYNPTSNFHEIQLPNRNVSGLGFRVPEKFCESSPLWRHVFWEELNIQFCNFCWSTFFARIFCWSTIFALHFLLINIFPIFLRFFVDQQFLQCLFCWSIFFARFFCWSTILAYSAFAFWGPKTIFEEVQVDHRMVGPHWPKGISESLFESLLTMNDSWNNHSICVGNIWFQPQKANYWSIELLLQPFWFWRNATLKGIMELTYPNGRRIFKRERLLANFKARYAHLGLDVVEDVTRVQYGCDASIHIYHPFRTCSMKQSCTPVFSANLPRQLQPSMWQVPRESGNVLCIGPKKLFEPRNLTKTLHVIDASVWCL